MRNCKVPYTQILKTKAIIVLLLCACTIITSCASPYAGGEKEVEKAVNQMNERIEEIRTTASEYDKNAKNIYYVSADGDDTNDGLSPETPFKSLKKANWIAKAGDVVLFRRGDEWRERWTAISGVTYSAYGEGPKPIINGNTYGDAADPSFWKLVDGTENIWEYKYNLLDVGCIVFNGGESTARKIFFEIHDKKVYVMGKEFEFSNYSFDANNTFISKYLHTMTDAAEPNSRTKLYLRCDEGNPGDVYDSIELMYRGNLIRGASDVTFDNLCIKYTGSHGIGMGTVENVTVRNCEVGYIGGSVGHFQNHYFVRYGNGIEVYGGCKNFTIDNCYVYQCYDAGVTHQVGGGEKPLYHENVYFTNNVIEKCIYDIEYFMGATDDGRYDERIIKNAVYRNNYLAYSGEGWGHDPSRAAGIKGWDSENKSDGFVIEENVFLLNKTDAWHLGAIKAEWLPEFKNNTYIHYKNSGFAKLGRPINGEYVSTQYMFDRKINSHFESIGETGSTAIFINSEVNRNNP